MTSFVRSLIGFWITIIVFYATIEIFPHVVSDTGIATYKSMRVKRLAQEEGAICLNNQDCQSWCCIYHTKVHGNCIKTPQVGEICGFVAESASDQPEAYYAVCEENLCESQCCCGQQCCPTNYCVIILRLDVKRCTHCAAGCCCNGSCCPLIFCHENVVNLLEGSEKKRQTVPGTPCSRCQSGCCCFGKCCLSLHCKGVSIGFQCEECPTHCCCGKTCCSSHYCEEKKERPARMLGLYHGLNQQYLPFLISLYGPQLFRGLLQHYAYKQNEIPTRTAPLPPKPDYSYLPNQVGVERAQHLTFNPPAPFQSYLPEGAVIRRPTERKMANLEQLSHGMGAGGPQQTGFVPPDLPPGAADLIPMHSPPPVQVPNYLGVNFNYFGASIATSTKGSLCLRCTTGCCCDFGCCSGSYCAHAEQQQNQTSEGVKQTRRAFQQLPYQGAFD